MKKSLLVLVPLFVFQNLNAQWVQLNGPSGGMVNAISGNGMDVFAASNESGVYHSPFNGVFWNHASTGMPTGTQVLSVAVSGNAILAATLTYMYRSTDNGQTWTQTALNAATNGFRHVALMDTVLFTGTYSNGIYKSVDHGLTWTYSGSGVPHQCYVRAFTKNGNDMYAATWNGGVFKSINNGSSWTSSNNGIPSMVSISLANSGSYIYAGTLNGAYVSSNNGASWSGFNNGLPNSYVNALLVKGNYLYAGTTAGVFKYNITTGVSGTWTQANNGIVYSNIYSLYTNGTQLFAAGVGGVHVSHDDGATWSESNTGLNINRVRGILKLGSHLFAATDLSTYDTQNNGALWNRLNLAAGPVQNWDILESGGNLLATSSNYSVNDVKISTDSGATWNTTTGIPINFGIISLEKSGNNVIAGTQSGSIYFSTNHGLNWGPAASPSGLNVNDISFAGATGFAAAFGSGLHRSTDSGQSWTLVPGTNFQNVQTVETDGNTVLASGSTMGTQISTNGGLSWNQITSFPATLVAFDFIIDGNNIVIGSDSGVHVSNDLGATWTQFNGGLLSYRILNLYRDGTRIYAGTMGSSVYYFDGLLSATEQINGSENVIKVYPNPATGREITVHINRQSANPNTWLELINISGQLVRSVRLNVSENAVTLDNVTPGIYSVRVVNNEGAWCQKLVVTDP
jgi:photosystem II stability/assembly factor-like uncharacterized protein